MRKLAIGLVAVATVLALAATLAWRNRIDLVVWGAPKLVALTSPVAENVPIDWQMGPATAERDPNERPPNIILILTDDMGFNDISLYNGGAADGSLQTPHMDAIARDGAVFTNGYAANAVCAPSRASLMTGRYSTRFGFEFTPFMKVGVTLVNWMQQLEPWPLPPIHINWDAVEALPDDPLRSFGMPPQEVTIAEVLQEAGYYTAHIGKWHLGAVGGMQPERQGFDDSLNMQGAFYLPVDHPQAVNAMREQEMIERMIWASARHAVQFNGGESFAPDGYLTDYYTREALKVIKNNRHRPFFLFLSHWGIHNPLQATRADYDALAHIDDHHLRVYAAMIRSVDRSVGQIAALLEELGLTENTLILFTSDNGGAGYIHLPDINKPFRGWKLNLFEGGIHVPFMAKWPARIPAGARLDAPVHHADLFQTIAAAAGAEVPTDRKLDGVDLMPFVTGRARGRPHETLFWREGYHQAVRHRDWKLIVSGKPDKRWLFDLAEDPTERVDLAASRPDKVAELIALLDAHNAEQAEPMWPPLLESPQRIDKHGGEPFSPDDEYIYWPN